jgi:hypothetical protein
MWNFEVCEIVRQYVKECKQNIKRFENTGCAEEPEVKCKRTKFYLKRDDATDPGVYHKFSVCVLRELPILLTNLYEARKNSVRVFHCR